MSKNPIHKDEVQVETTIELPPRMELVERFWTIGFHLPSGAPVPPAVVPIITRINAEFLQHYRWAPHMLRYGFHKAFKLLRPFAQLLFSILVFGWIPLCIPEFEGRARHIWIIIYIVNQLLLAPFMVGACVAKARCCATNYPIIRFLRQRVQPLVDEANQTVVAEGIRLHLEVIDKSRKVSYERDSGEFWVFEMESSLVVYQA